MNLRKTLLILFMGCEITLFAQLSVKEVLERNEQQQYGQYSYSEMTMQIVRPKWTREVSMKAWTRGDDYALVLITAPAKEKGQGFLKRKGELWNWLPSIDRVVKMSASVMGQSWMGSDFTNGDMVQGTTFLNDYTSKLLPDVTVDGRRCYQVELIPLPQSPVVWGRVVVSIDKEDFNALKGEYYDEEGVMTQTTKGLEVKMVGGRRLVTRMEVQPMDKPGQKTVMIVRQSDRNRSIPENFFSLQNLKTVQ